MGMRVARYEDTVCMVKYLIAKINDISHQGLIYFLCVYCYVSCFFFTSQYQNLLLQKSLHRLHLVEQTITSENCLERYSFPSSPPAPSPLEVR